SASLCPHTVCPPPDRFIELIATADLVAVTARTKTVVRARTLIDLGTDNVPTGPIVEEVTGADRILAGGIVEQISLQCQHRCKHRIVDAQHRRGTGSFERGSIRRTPR